MMDRVALIRRRPDRLPLRAPRLDGGTWPTRREVGRASFAASALYQMGYGEAFTPQAHDIADALLEQVLPRLTLGSAPDDLPHLRQLLSAAAQVGAGIGLVEQRAGRHDDPHADPHAGHHVGHTTDRHVAGALLEARDELAAMPAHQHAVATYLLQCGYYLARTGVGTLPVLLAGLDDQR